MKSLKSLCIFNTACLKFRQVIFQELNSQMWLASGYPNWTVHTHTYTQRFIKLLLVLLKDKKVSIMQLKWMLYTYTYKNL